MAILWDRNRLDTVGSRADASMGLLDPGQPHRSFSRFSSSWKNPSSSMKTVTRWPKGQTTEGTAVYTVDEPLRHSLQEKDWQGGKHATDRWDNDKALVRKRQRRIPRHSGEAQPRTLSTQKNPFPKQRQKSKLLDRRARNYLCYTEDAKGAPLAEGRWQCAGDTKDNAHCTWRCHWVKRAMSLFTSTKGNWLLKCKQIEDHSGVEATGNTKGCDWVRWYGP